MNILKSPGSPAPLVSIVIPTYNYAHYLPKAIESALVQTYPNIEIIVIDDGSTDNTVETIEPYRDRIQYVHQSNSGLSAARNNGLELAKGEFVLFLDSDDFIRRRCIEKQIQHLLVDDKYNFVVCNSRYYYDHFSSYLKPNIANLIGWRIPQKSSVSIALCFHNIAPVHAFLTRKSIIDKHGLRFDTTLTACEDYDFWLKFVLKGGLPALENGVHALYRQHHTSMSKNLSNQYHHDFIMAKRVHDILSSRPVCIGDSMFECMVSHLTSCVTIWNHLKPEEESIYYKELSSIADETLNQLNDCRRPRFLNTHLLERLGHEIYSSSFPSNIDTYRIKNFYDETKNLYLLSAGYIFEDMIKNRSISNSARRAYYKLKKQK